MGLSNLNRFLHTLVPGPHLGEGRVLPHLVVVRPLVRRPDCRNHNYTSSGDCSMTKLGWGSGGEEGGGGVFVLVWFFFFTNLVKKKNPLPLWCFLGLLSSRTFVLVPQLERELCGLGGRSCRGGFAGGWHMPQRLAACKVGLPSASHPLLSGMTCLCVQAHEGKEKPWLA